MAKQGAGGIDPIDEGGEPMSEVDEMIPVSGEVVWRARAEEAEERVATLEAQVLELESQLSSARETISSVERRGEIDRELTAAKAVDLETARLLTEAAIGEMDEPDVAIAVRDLCQRKPFLFACRSGGGRRGTAMSPAPSGGAVDELDEIAQRARSSGDRSELLRYLRVRRGQ